jgi:hypothetical protein
LGSTASGKCLDRYTEITLRPLRPQESRRLVESLLSIENLPEAVKDTILKKAEGNPFFVEEVIRSLIDSGVVYHDGERWVAKADAGEIAVPDTIQSVILSRIDRLEEDVKYVLQSEGAALSGEGGGQVERGVRQRGGDCVLPAGVEVDRRRRGGASVPARPARAGLSRSGGELLPAHAA